MIIEKQMIIMKKHIDNHLVVHVLDVLMINY